MRPGFGANGIQSNCIHCEGRRDNNPRRRRFGVHIQRRHDPDKESRFYVLVHTEAPACLVEMAFISNDEEAALLANARWQSRQAGAIARGIAEYANEKGGTQ